MLTYLIPTAKEMKLPDTKLTPTLSQKSSAIVEKMSQLTIEELAKAYKITPVAAEKEFDRWQAIQTGTAPTYPAAQLFNGLMYRHLDRQLLTVQAPVYITSALYGVIQALEPIAEHRLDFHTKAGVKGQSLKSYWRADYDAFASEQEQVISLLSSEFADGFSPQIRDNFITISFMEEKDGQLKSHSTISKKARGTFLTQALEAKASGVNELKRITFDGFAFSDQLSAEKQLVFVKKLEI